MSAYTRDGLIREATLIFLNNLNKTQPPSDIEGLKTDLIDGINDNISMYNACVYSKDRKFKCISTLPGFVIVEIMLYFRLVVNIHLNGEVMSRRYTVIVGKTKVFTRLNRKH